VASRTTTTYWLDLFTGTTWQEFIDAGADVSCFRESRWSTVQQVRPGDYLLCYLTGISRFVGLLEVVSPPYRDSTPIWKDETFPCPSSSPPSCGQLIDVTAAPGIRATDSCGDPRNHVITGPDATVLP
jgi:hypothetical protein